MHDTIGAIVFGVLCLMLVLIALACLWAALQGAWKRDWKFAAGALFLALVMGLGALDMWEGAHGRGGGYDPSVPRIR